MKHELQRIINTEQDIVFAQRWLDALVRKGLEAGPVRVSIGRPRRTQDQNSLMWPILDDIARQVEWHGMKLSKEDWKELLTASLRKQRAVPGIDGGFVIIGASTRTMDKQTFSMLIELIYAFGAEHGVKFRTDRSEIGA
jgi:hypothetical protein